MQTSLKRNCCSKMVFAHTGTLYIFWLLFLCLPWQIVAADILASYTLKDNTVCATDKSLIIVSAYEVEKLSSMMFNKLSLISVLDQQLRSVSFQLDRKDEQGRYILSNNASMVKLINAQDELVFRKQDLGERLKADSQLIKNYSLIEIKVTTKQTAVPGWIYIVSGVPLTAGEHKSIVYQTAQDSVSSAVYKIAFAAKKPFLLDSFQWNLSGKMPEVPAHRISWSPDISDTMKIRHTGRFLGFSFKRTDDDYVSRLVAVKQGPLRIIRRTENRVKVFWKLKSPVLYIDYVMMPDGFVMDSMVDIPFKIAFFFSDLSTITTMDWNNTVRDNLHIIYQQADLNLLVNGVPTPEKNAFNNISARNFLVDSQFGQFSVRLDIPDDFPLEAQLFLRDDLNAIDPPENYPGQYGNVGFKTTGWENIDNKLYHLKFTVCVDDN